MSKARQNVDKLNDIINVRDYGAVSGNAGAAAANSTAFAAAFAAVAALPVGGTVFVPAGIWYLSTTLTFPAADRIALAGEDQHQTLLYFTQTNAPGIVIAGAAPSTFRSYCTIRDLLVYFPNGTTTPASPTDDKNGAVGIKLSFTSRPTVKNVWIFDALLGVYIGSSLSPDIDRVVSVRAGGVATGNRYRGMWIDGTSANPLGYASPNPSLKINKFVSSVGALVGTATATGIYVNGQAADLFLFDPETAGGEYGIDMDLTDIAANSNLDILIRRPVLDAYSKAGLRIDGNGSLWSSIAIDSLYAAPSASFSGTASLDIRDIRGISMRGRIEVDGLAHNNHVAFYGNTIYDCVVDGLEAKQCGTSFDIYAAGTSTFKGRLFHSGEGSFTATNANRFEFLTDCEVNCESVAGAGTIWTNGVNLISPNTVVAEVSGINGATNVVNYGGALTRGGWYAASVYISGINAYQDTGKGTFGSGTAIPAGGSTNVGLTLTSTANFGVFAGSGAPTLSAAKGSLYLRSDGSGITDRAYINTDGATTWAAITTDA